MSAQQATACARVIATSHSRTYWPMPTVRFATVPPSGPQQLRSQAAMHAQHACREGNALNPRRRARDLARNRAATDAYVISRRQPRCCSRTSSASLDWADCVFVDQTAPKTSSTLPQPPEPSQNGKALFASQSSRNAANRRSVGKQSVNVSGPNTD